MKRLYFVSLIIFLVSGCSQNTSTFDLPENQGVSSERLDRIDSYLNKAIKDNQIPGAVALIRRNNKIIYNGLAKRRRKF